MQIQFATKKVDGVYEVALIVDGKFQRSGSGKDVLQLLSRLAGPVLATKQEDGSEVVVTIAISTAAEVARAERSAERQRETAAAEQEATELTRLNEAQVKEANAAASRLS